MTPNVFGALFAWARSTRAVVAEPLPHAEKAIEELRHQLDSLRGQAARAQQVLAATHAELEAMRDGFAAFRDRLGALEARVATIDEVDRHRWNLQHRINVLREDYEQERERGAAMRADLDALRGQWDAGIRDALAAAAAPAGRLETANGEAPDLESAGDRWEALDRHRWELQHRINLLEDTFRNAKSANREAAIAACRQELAVFRRDFEDVFRKVYGAVGAGFQRLQIPGAAQSLGERFGEQEVKRQERLSGDGT